MDDKKSHAGILAFVVALLAMAVAYIILLSSPNLPTQPAARAEKGAEWWRIQGHQVLPCKLSEVREGEQIRDKFGNYWLVVGINILGDECTVQCRPHYPGPIEFKESK